MARRALTAAVGAGFCLVVAVRSLTSEVFLDGVTYASIARNLALGVGTFWAPQLAEGVPPFREHPPLALWLEAQGYRLFGDTALVDVYWGVALAALSTLLLAAIWRVAHALAGRAPAAGAWWPIGLWLAFPLASWCWTNNLLENTLVPLTLGGVAASLAALGSRGPRALAWWTVGGAAVGLGLLTKGPVAAFVLAVPLLAALLLPQARRPGVALGGLWAVIVAVGLAALALLAGGEAGAAFWDTYVQQQLVRSIAAQRELAPTRWLTVLTLARELTVPALVCGALALARRRLPGPGAGRVGWLLLAVAAAASLPFSLFAKQMEWYVAPALPLVAVGLAMAFEPQAAAVEEWAAELPGRTLGLGVASALTVAGAGALLVSCRGAVTVELGVLCRDAVDRALGRPARDEVYSEYDWRAFNRDVLAPGARIPPRETVWVQAPNSYFRLAAYVQRSFRATPSDRPGPRYVLVDRAGRDGLAQSVNCQRSVPGDSGRLVLYECRF